MKANRTKQKKSTLYLVRTKASELADFPGVNPKIAMMMLTNENQSFSVECRQSHYLLIGYYIKLVKD